MTVTNHEPSRAFEIVASTLAGWTDPAIAIAASRAGASGVLNLEHTTDVAAARSALARLTQFGRGTLGIKLDARGGLVSNLLCDLPTAINLVILTEADARSLGPTLALVRAPGRRVLVESTNVDEGRCAIANGADGLVAKGHEAGGHVGDETTFVLIQRLRAETDRPVWAYGGIGLHSAAACYVAGCAGVVLDAQLALARESTVPPKLRAALERMEGDETICLGSDRGDLYRVYRRPGAVGVDALQHLEPTLAQLPAEEARAQWRDAIRARLGWEIPETQIWPLGQDAAFAARLARRFHTVAGIVDGLHAAVVDHLRRARDQRALDRGAPLAQAHGTDYPILQGPMTRVSDTAEFAEAVSEGGALPFLALALLRAPQVRTLLEETRTRLGDRPWGVGILGFVPLEIRQEQLEVIGAIRPRFAIIAGGRPDQAARLEANGIATYLHVPAPGLLRMYLEDGARRFIFEGRECGGHVGPRTSFVLWQTMIDALLDAVDGGIPASELHLVFAGGIHDAVSAAMVATMAAELVDRGARIGVLLGTAYLFTEEAVRASAIVEGFQREALGCTSTVLLETGPGHSTRCVETPFYDTFRQTKRRLLAEGLLPEEIRAELEKLNLGRLRIASKGMARDTELPDPNQPRYVAVDLERQHQEGMFMIGQVAALRTRVRRIADLHEDVTQAGVRFLEGVPLPAGPATKVIADAPRPSSVAIIGMGCLLPGAPDLATFWANVLNKVDAITEVPKDRFDIDLYYDADRKARDKVYSRWGGFLGDVPFDPLRYGIPPTALPSIDSLQLLSLEVVRQALADAGYLDREFGRERTSVILGLSGGLGDLGLNYGIRSNLPALFGEMPAGVIEQLPEWTEDSFAGILLNVTAGRIANRFDLGGVNYTVDAACASSLAAVYLAVSELEARTSDMVIVGGVDTVQSPFGFLCFSKSQALSPRGRCRTFDASADGIAISEGLTMLVLKRLEDAERDGDRIYAVIKAVAGSSDGRGRSLTAPRPEGQTLALERAYARAGISPATVGLIEAHGTGTVAGDAAEVAALSDVFQAAGASPASCAIGSVKSMIGHTKSAAGVTGLAKVALALHHKVLPPTLHVETPNPNLREADSPFFVIGEPLPWLASEAGTPRRAGVSSFGFGGTNFHAVIEEHVDDYTDPMTRKTMEVWPAELFVWTAALASTLNASLKGLEESLDRGAHPTLRSLAAAVCAAGSGATDGVRLAIVATDLTDLRAKLAVARGALQAGSTHVLDPKGVYLQEARQSAGRLAFLFPGQGSQAPGMLLDLAQHFPHVRESCEQADRVLQGRLPQRLSSYIFPPRDFTLDAQKARMEAITDTVVAQPALGAVEIGLVHLLHQFGVQPDMVAGHSYGEYVALAVAGAMSERALFDISEARGRAIKESVGETPGTMAAVHAPAESVAAALSGVPNVWLANLNAPKQTIIAGAPDDVEAAIRQLVSAGLRAQKIPVACAFHSPLMDRARNRLAAEVARLALMPPRIPVFSNSHAAPYPEDPVRMAALLSEHLVKPVRFFDEIRAMYDAGARLFLEVGPRSVLTGLVRQILNGHEVTAVATDAGDRNGLVHLLHALAQLVAAGVDVRLDRLFQGRNIEPARFDQDEPLTSGAATVKWVVNGAGARPVGQPSVRRPPIAAPLVQRSEPTQTVAKLPVVSPTPAIPAQEVAVHTAAAGSVAPSDALMLQFQNLMSQFLQTQAAVMTAYLQGGGTEEAATASQFVPAASPPAPVEMQVAPAPPAPASAPSVALGTEVLGFPTASGPSAEVPQRDVKADLLRIVSERTGYPVEMLKIDLNIEADLGIDSIKRVEVLSAFQRRCSPDEQQRVQAAMDRLTALKTLREVIATLTETVSDDAKPTQAAAVSTEQLLPSTVVAADVEEVPRFTLMAVDAPLEVDPSRVFPGRTWLISDDEGGLADTIAARLADAGERPVLLRQQPAVSVLGPKHYGADLTRADQTAEVLARIRHAHGAPCALLHLLPLKAGTEFDDLSFDQWRERVQQDIKTLYCLIREAGSDLTTAGRTGGAMIVAATGLAVSPAGGMPDAFPTHGGVSAMLKTIAVEMPEVICRAVGLDLSEPQEQLAARILSELRVADGPGEVGYTADRRLTLVPKLTLLDNVTNGVDFGPDSVILITGGARGITAEIAAYFAAAFSPTLVIAGLSVLPADESPEPAGLHDPAQLKAALTVSLRAEDPTVRPIEIERALQRELRNREIRRNLAALARTGTRVVYRQVDVRDGVAFGSLIDDIYSRHGRLDAIIHGAGIIEDKLLRDKTPESFDRVVHTKTDSAFTLVRKVRLESLKLLIFMSSVTATFGNRGQADYGAANGVLNALASMLVTQWPCRVRALNWGPWDKTGMVSDEVKRQFASRGIQVIPVAAGVAAVAREISVEDASDAIVVIGGGPWQTDTLQTREVEITA